MLASDFKFYLNLIFYCCCSWYNIGISFTLLPVLNCKTDCLTLYKMARNRWLGYLFRQMVNQRYPDVDDDNADSVSANDFGM